MNSQLGVKNSVLNPFDSIMGKTGVLENRLIVLRTVQKRNSVKREETTEKVRGEKKMGMGLSLQPLLALIAGILILIFPRVLNFIIAIYLIVYGILGFVHS